MNSRNDTGERQKFIAALQRALHDGTFTRLRAQPDRAAPFDARLVDLAGGRALQIVTHEPTRDLTRNVPASEAAAELARLLPGHATAWLETTTRSLQLIDVDGQRPRCVAHKASRPVDAQHDRARKSRLADAATLLAALDLADEKGRPRPGRADKLRQIERYADLLAHAAQQAGWKAGDAITLADMGCGKAYLTFAAWHVLRRGLGLDAAILGVDLRADLVAADEALARRLGCEGLSFRQGAIRDAELPRIDALIALHACDDATDHAIERGLAAGAKLIIVAPCCHKQVRRQLGKPEPLAPLLEHGLFKERFAEWLTDGLRLLRLEAAGYRVTVAEFVDAGHTPKNVLLTAVRGSTPDRMETARAELAALEKWAELQPGPAATATSAATR